MKRKLIGFFIHMPVGVLNAWLFVLNPHYGWAFLFMFALYECWQGFRTRDFAHLDIIGWLGGFPLFFIGKAIWFYFVTGLLLL